MLKAFSKTKKFRPPVGILTTEWYQFSCKLFFYSKFFSRIFCLGKRLDIDQKMCLFLTLINSYTLLLSLRSNNTVPKVNFGLKVTFLAKINTYYQTGKSVPFLSIKLFYSKDIRVQELDE